MSLEVVRHRDQTRIETDRQTCNSFGYVGILRASAEIEIED